MLFLCFPMLSYAFLCLPYAFPCVPMVSLCFPIAFLCFSYAFLCFPMLSYASPMLFPIPAPSNSQLLPLLSRTTQTAGRWACGGWGEAKSRFWENLVDFFLVDRACTVRTPEMLILHRSSKHLAAGGGPRAPSGTLKVRFSDFFLIFLTSRGGSRAPWLDPRNVDFT